MKLNPAFINRAPSSAFVAWLVALTSIVWLFWQVWGIEIMRTPWEDEILYVLPAVNWVKHGSFAIPQLGAFAAADVAWGWHVPGFSLGMAAWLLLFPLELWSIRLFTLIPAVLVNALLLYMAFRVGAIRHMLSLSVWLFVIFFDKSLVSQSVTGRMEFHAVLLLLAALCVLLLLPDHSTSRRVAVSIFASGFLFGLSAAFHPLTLYFGPVLAVVAIFTPCVHQTGVLRNALAGAVGATIPAAVVASWFYFAGGYAQQQFALSVIGSTAENTRGSFLTVIDTILFVYRFQPAIVGVIVLVMWAVLMQSKHLLFRGWRSWGIAERCLVAGIAGTVCFMFAILRGSTQHLNYYTFLTVFFLLAVIAAYVISQQSATPVFRVVGMAVILLLAFNNLAFSAFKTYVIVSNQKDWDEARLEEFLSPITRNSDKRYVLSPKLWLWAESKNLNWRASYLTLVGQPPATHAAYHQSILEWNPHLIILDGIDWPERRIAGGILESFGFRPTNSFAHIFTYRARYSAGWDLQVYRKEK